MVQFEPNYVFKKIVIPLYSLITDYFTLFSDNKENLTAENTQDHTKTGSNGSMLHEQKPLSKEEHLINRLQAILTGIPPPPAVTVPQIDCGDILKLWKANEQLAAEYKKCMPPGNL